MPALLGNPESLSSPTFKASYSAPGRSVIKGSCSVRGDSANLNFWLFLWFLLLEDLNQIFLTSVLLPFFLELASCFVFLKQTLF